MIKTVTDYLEQTVKVFPDKIAFADDYHGMTFNELREAALKIANRLVSMGLYRQPVAIFMDKSPECIAAFLGVAYSGNFYSPIDSIPVEKYIPAINAFLPDDIRIVGSSEVAQDFSSRFSATSRTYRYFIHTGNPFASEMRFVWPIHHKPDITVLNKMASYLRGEIDCATFAAAGDASLSTFRYIENARFFVDDKNPEVIVFEICANAFLWKMVRSLTGSLIFFEKTGRSPEYFKEVLDSHDRKRAGPTAPPSGLFLYQVSFDGVRRHA